MCVRLVMDHQRLSAVADLKGVVKIECPDCDGNRFSNLMDEFRLEGLNISEFYRASLIEIEK